MFQTTNQYKLVYDPINYIATDKYLEHHLEKI